MTSLSGLDRRNDNQTVNLTGVVRESTRHEDKRMFNTARLRAIINFLDENNEESMIESMIDKVQVDSDFCDYHDYYFVDSDGDWGWKKPG